MTKIASRLKVIWRIVHAASRLLFNFVLREKKEGSALNKAFPKIILAMREFFIFSSDVMTKQKCSITTMSQAQVRLYVLNIILEIMHLAREKERTPNMANARLRNISCIFDVSAPRSFE